MSRRLKYNEEKTTILLLLLDITVFTKSQTYSTYFPLGPKTKLIRRAGSFYLKREVRDCFQSNQ